MFLVERSLAGLRRCLAQFLHKTLVQHAQMSHVGGITKGNVDVQGGKRVQKRSAECHKPRIKKKKKKSVQGIEMQKFNYISALREKKLTTLRLFAFV